MSIYGIAKRGLGILGKRVKTKVNALKTHARNIEAGKFHSGKTKPSETSKITSQKMGGKASQAGSAPTKGKLEFGKGSKGVSVKPSGKKTLTKEYLKKLEIKKNLSKK